MCELRMKLCRRRRRTQYQMHEENDTMDRGVSGMRAGGGKVAQGMWTRIWLCVVMMMVVVVVVVVNKLYGEMAGERDRRAEGEKSGQQLAEDAERFG
jgi:hypothetical protein